MCKRKAKEKKTPLALLPPGMGFPGSRAMHFGPVAPTVALGAHEKVCFASVDAFRRGCRARLLLAVSPEGESGGL